MAVLSRSTAGQVTASIMLRSSSNNLCPCQRALYRESRFINIHNIGRHPGTYRFVISQSWASTKKKLRIIPGSFLKPAADETLRPYTLNPKPQPQKPESHPTGPTSKCSSCMTCKHPAVDRAKTTESQNAFLTSGRLETQGSPRIPQATMIFQLGNQPNTDPNSRKASYR